MYTHGQWVSNMFAQQPLKIITNYAFSKALTISASSGVPAASTKDFTWAYRHTFWKTNLFVQTDAANS